MFRRLVILSLLLAAVFSSSALAANIKVRVEGRTQTIYGSVQPSLQADNALQALDVASTAGEFHYVLTPSSFGDYVSQIGKYAAGGTSGWVFKVNGASPPVGADKVVLKDGDVVLWYWATLRHSRRAADARSPPPAGQLLQRRLPERRGHARADRARDAARGRQAVPGPERPRLHRQAHRPRPRDRGRRRALELGAMTCGASARFCSASSPAVAEPARRPAPRSSGSLVTGGWSSCSRPRCRQARR